MILNDLLFCAHVEVPLSKILDPSLLQVALPSVCECLCMVNAPDEQVALCTVAFVVSNYFAIIRLINYCYTHPWCHYCQSLIWHLMSLSLCFLSQVYPGLMVTAGLIHYVLNLLHITVHIRDVCVFLAPVFSGLTAISTFLLTRELWNQGAGLLAACFIAIVPGYISRSVAGSFDNEGIAIFALQFTYYLWVCT